MEPCCRGIAGNADGRRYLITTYTYDGLGRRVSKTVSHCGSRDGAAYMYYNNKWQLLEIRTAPTTAKTPSPATSRASSSSGAAGT